jgi:hypothetical protein
MVFDDRSNPHNFRASKTIEVISVEPTPAAEIAASPPRTSAPTTSTISDISNLTLKNFSD